MSYLLQAFTEASWAILPSKLNVIKEIVSRHVSGEKLNAEEVQTRIHGAVRPAEQRIPNPKKNGISSVAVLPLFGTIFPRANMMTEMSGATSAELFGNQFSQLLADESIDAIILNVDSPGGVVNGIAEVAQKIFEARGKKPIVAVANTLAASAAYWIATATDELIVSPSGRVGSIGVFAVHEDISKALENEGVRTSLISAGKYKTEGNPYEALTEEARASIQSSVNETYEMFIETVARHRNVKVADVRYGFGEGRVVSAQQAVTLGMADRVETLEQTIERLLQNLPSEQQSSNVVKSENQRKAQSLRVRVESILNKESNTHA